MRDFVGAMLVIALVRSALRMWANTRFAPTGGVAVLGMMTNVGAILYGCPAARGVLGRLGQAQDLPLQVWGDCCA